jgi:hypothetical protein
LRTNDVQADYHINRVMMAVSSKELHSALESAKAAQNNGADLGTKFVEKVSRDVFFLLLDSATLFVLHCCFKLQSPR